MQVLSRHVYRPLRRQGVPRGVCLASTFLLSGSIHGVPLAVLQRDIDWYAQACIHGYFLVQAMGVMLEDALAIDENQSNSRRNAKKNDGCAARGVDVKPKVQEGLRLGSRVWTLACVLLPTPLLFAPYYQTIFSYN